ncbi:hypothetical protein Tco_1189410 [Tanacetum coccineum]
MLFDNTMKWVDSFVPMDTEVVDGSKSHAEESKKRTREELESNNLKKQKIDENVEAEVNDEVEMKKHMEIVPDNKVAIDAIPLATKSPIIIDWKIIKEGKMGYFQIIKAAGSSRRYSLMIRMLQNIDREDLEILWKLDVESEVWRNLQGYNATVWKLFSLSGVHFMRFQDQNIFMLVEKNYPLTPATITKMLNKKLQTDHWNEMCYQLLKLMTKQRKNPGIGINKTFHEQNDDELTEAEIKQMEADDQAIQTILLGLPQDIYAAVDSYETAQEIWLRVQQMMKGSDIGIQVKKDKLCWELY